MNEFSSGGGTAGEDSSQWGDEFDGIRSDVDFRRALAIQNLPVLQRQPPARRMTPTSALASANVGLIRGLKAIRTMGEVLAAWRAIRVPMR